jgi:hypothetical protein
VRLFPVRQQERFDPFTGTAAALTAQHFAAVVTLAARFSFWVKLTVALSTEPQVIQGRKNLIWVQHGHSLVLD